MAAAADIPRARARRNWQLALAALKKQHRFALLVLACSGDTVCTVQASPHWKVRQLKFAIEDASNLRALSQQVLVGGSVLNDTDCLQDVLPSEDADRYVTVVRVEQAFETSAHEGFMTILGRIRRRAANRGERLLGNG
eukprot:TRINITY_DN5844_c0_g1_i2.p2 TRINITY_DN5844_c0_g1~~TRINITY_DN5844_c0_g1_i2.p2  ORF type:complete len:138 (-),score=16.86 TRINITY_DN5844_c0_g1_i2:63-476(-)